MIQVRSPKSPKTSLAAQAVLRRVESERDESMTSLRKISTERDTLRERLKIATEAQLADRARLEQRCEDLQTALAVVSSAYTIIYTTMQHFSLYLHVTAWCHLKAMFRSAMV